MMKELLIHSYLTIFDDIAKKYKPQMSPKDNDRCSPGLHEPALQYREIA